MIFPELYPAASASVRARDSRVSILLFFFRSFPSFVEKRSFKYNRRCNYEMVIKHFRGIILHGKADNKFKR